MSPPGCAELRFGSFDDANNKNILFLLERLFSDLKLKLLAQLNAESEHGRAAQYPVHSGITLF